MGISTTQQLIARGQNENSYNNSGINSNAQWVDFFNDALNDLVDDLNITDALTISFDPATAEREYDLPTNFFSLLELYDGNGTPVRERRVYGASSMTPFRGGYWILNKGSKYVIDLYQYDAAQTFSGLYVRYPATLSTANISTEKPEVPSVGEKALIFYALGKALRNNNQVGQAIEMESKYEAEKKKIRSAAARAGA